MSNQRRWKVFSYKVGGFPWYIYCEFDVFEFATYLKLGVIYLNLAAMYSSFWQNTKLRVFEVGKEGVRVCVLQDADSLEPPRGFSIGVEK